MLDTEGWIPRNGWSDDQWLTEARQLRDALAVMGEGLPACLPGEEAACGEPAWGHYVAYCALLKAKAAALIAVNISPTAPRLAHEAGEHMYKANFKDILDEFGKCDSGDYREI